MLRVLHLVGSGVDEFFCDLSRLYAADCLAATADPARYEFVVAYVTPQGWRFPAGLDPEQIAAAPLRTLPEAVAEIARAEVDVMVPQMFCRPGMTHHRALFELLGIGYVGNTPEVMALGADKALARAVVAEGGVAVPAGETVRAGQAPTVRPPAVVKPADTDNSVGVTLVHDPDGFEVAVKAALVHGDRALVEEFVPLGREVRCAVVERDGDLVGLPLEEYRMDAVDKPVRLADDKLARTGDGDLRLVAKDARSWIVDAGDPVTRPVQDAARAAFRALGCRDYGLFDFRIDPDGRPWFLEAGLYCSFARTSVVVTMAEAAGIGVADLFADAVTRAAARTTAPPGSDR
ncbi:MULTISPECIES: D-alanine--D-alanine ligase [Pseudonocardia]|uniref:D-alanine-D-alanine ligase n=1 Tax=Pseudonocardia alni TaxID=33907 RepID=A0A852WD56_PSEA5|nr:MULTISPECIES: D-alanine--D-alanine ligase [Pseudonocardia]MCO7196183.1 D-alanine--D-alanine ligase [Pseudonocardia sp. McavD-2-B]NYG04654.1 D-alanine-D-alanine ligase [Pseudonocardia antarctica]